MDMLGIVVWRSSVSAAAIMLCDDGSQLAFATDIFRACNPERPPKVGDLVRMRVDDREGVRKCTHMMLVSPGENGTNDAVMEQFVLSYGGGLHPVRGLANEAPVANNDKRPTALPNRST